MSTNIGGNKSRFDQFAMILPADGPVCIPDIWDFTANERTEVDLSLLTENGWVDFVAGVYIDNSDNTGYLTFECGGTIQRFPFPAGAAGYIPLFLPNPPKVYVTSTADATVRFQWYNTPVFPLVLTNPTQGTGTDVNVTNPSLAVTGNWLTDTQLRASPVPVTPTQPIGAAYTDRSIANLSGASQTLMAANANRRTLFIQNIAANNMAVNFVGGAAAIGVAGSVTLLPGASILFDNFPPAGAVTIIGTANDDVTAYEG